MLFGLWRTERFRISGFSEMQPWVKQERDTDGDGSGTDSEKGEVGGLSGAGIFGFRGNCVDERD